MTTSAELNALAAAGDEVTVEDLTKTLVGIMRMPDESWFVPDDEMDAAKFLCLSARALLTKFHIHKRAEG